MTVYSKPREGIILYSAPCATAVPYGVGTSMLVTASQVSFETRQMTVGEIKDAANKLDTAIEVAKALLDIGDAALEFLQNEFGKSEDRELWQGRLKAIAGVGEIIHGILKFIPKPDDPMVGQLQKLSDHVEQLAEKVNQHFDEMKILISEVNFFVKILSPTFIMTRYMRDCIKNPCPTAKKNFEKAYLRHSPMKLVYNLMGALEQKSSNPLRMAMDAEKIKTKATFKRWEKIVSQILAQFMFQEAFATGLFKLENTKNLDRLIARCGKISNLFQTWKEEYGKDYWSDMSNFMSNLSKYSNQSNKQKADRIVKQLENCLTNDSFYVLVFNTCKWQEDYTYYCNNESDQILGNWSSAGCKALIYRSKMGNHKSEASYTEIKSQVDLCVSGQLTYNGTLGGAIKNQLLNTNRLSENNFTAMIWKDMNPEIRSANCPGHEWGPGWWRRVEVQDTRKSDVWTYYLISSFE